MAVSKEMLEEFERLDQQSIRREAANAELEIGKAFFIHLLKQNSLRISNELPEKDRNALFEQLAGFAGDAADAFHSKWIERSKT